MHCLASPRRQCVSIRLFLETDRGGGGGRIVPGRPRSPANYRFIACFSDRPTASVRPAAPPAWILLHGDAVDIGRAPSGNARLNFHSGRLKLNLVTNLLASTTGRPECRQADLLISATLRRPSLVTGQYARSRSSIVS